MKPWQDPPWLAVELKKYQNEKLKETATFISVISHWNRLSREERNSSWPGVSVKTRLL